MVNLLDIWCWLVSSSMRKLFQSNFLLFFIVFLWSAWLFIDTQKTEPYPTGDGIEYVLTTEALANHFSSDIRKNDFISFKKSYCKNHEWISNYKSATFDEIEVFLSQNKRKEFGGFYKNQKAKTYGYHFVFYSLINVPGRWITKISGGNPFSSFQWTNAIFLIAFLVYALFYWKASFALRIAGSSAVLFSGLYYYTCWIHPETLTTVLVAIGLMMLWDKKHLLSIGAFTLATLQNQPLLILLIWALLSMVYFERKNWRLWLKGALIAIMFIIPSFYFYYLFGTTSLIKDAGFLSIDNITLTRLFGFFFDLNQGMIIGLGFVLICYLILLFIRVYQCFKEKKANHWDFIPLIIILLTLIVSSMNNWNHGMAIVNRYSVWIAMPMVFHALFISSQWQKESFFIGTWSVLILSQIVLLKIHVPFNKFDWSSLEHMPIAKWALENEPSYYNPDPQIFIVRTSRQFNFSESSSPVFYRNSNQKITKVAVHELGLDTLAFFGYPQKRLVKCKSVYSEKNKWYYINDFELYSKIKGKRLEKLLREKEIERIVFEIKQNPQWMMNIEKKAKETNVTLEKQLHLDAEYTYEAAHPRN